MICVLAAVALCSMGFISVRPLLNTRRPEPVKKCAKHSDNGDKLDGLTELFADVDTTDLLTEYAQDRLRRFVAGEVMVPRPSVVSPARPRRIYTEPVERFEQVLRIAARENVPLERALIRLGVNRSPLNYYCKDVHGTSPKKVVWRYR